MNQSVITDTAPSEATPARATTRTITIAHSASTDAVPERRGLRIHEVPVDWVDDPDSRVDVLTTSIADLKGIWRLSRAFAGERGRPGKPPTPRSMLPSPTAGKTRWPFPAAAMIAWLVWFLADRRVASPLWAEVAALTAAGLLAAVAGLTAWAVAAVPVVALSQHHLAPSHPAGIPGPTRTPAQGP